MGRLWLTPNWEKPKGKFKNKGFSGGLSTKKGRLPKKREQVSNWDEVGYFTGVAVLN